MKTWFSLLTFILVYSVLQGDSPVGTYFPNKELSFKLIFNRIPSSSFLIIKSDSSYYHESIWGSFKDWENGMWENINDTILRYPIEKDNDGKINKFNFSSIKNDSFPENIRISVNGKNLSLAGLKINFYKDSAKTSFITDRNGVVFCNKIEFDSVVFTGDRYSRFQRCHFTKGLHGQNDYRIDLNYYLNLLKKNKLYNITGKAVAKRKAMLIK